MTSVEEEMRMGEGGITSLVKVEANRLNAQRSTGPRTPEGKAMARLNALKHGLLSREVILAEENARDLDDLGRRLRAELHPATELEVLLVDRVASCLWRIRRALQAETAEIDRSRLELLEDREDPGAYHGTDHYAAVQTTAEARLESAKQTLGWLKAGGDPLVGDLEEDSPLAGLFDALADRHFHEMPQDTPAIEIRDHARAQGWTAEKLRNALASILKEKVREARAALRDAQHLVRAHEKRQEESRRLVLLAQGVPGDETLNRLLRYETTIERQLYRALHELQRLQAVRAGQPLLAPVVVDVDVGVSRDDA
jgi:hypothetical protein